MVGASTHSVSPGIGRFQALTVRHDVSPGSVDVERFHEEVLHGAVLGFLSLIAIRIANGNDSFIPFLPRFSPYLVRKIDLTLFGLQ